MAVSRRPQPYVAEAFGRLQFCVIFRQSIGRVAEFCAPVRSAIPADDGAMPPRSLGADHALPVLRGRGQGRRGGLQALSPRAIRRKAAYRQRSTKWARAWRWSRTRPSMPARKLRVTRAAHRRGITMPELSELESVALIYIVLVVAYFLIVVHFDLKLIYLKFVSIAVPLIIGLLRRVSGTNGAQQRADFRFWSSRSPSTTTSGGGRLRSGQSAVPAKGRLRVERTRLLRREHRVRLF